MSILGIILLVFIVLLLFGGLSGHVGGYGYGLGHGGIGIVGFVLIVLLILVLTGRL